jgi:hypothetical protein
MPSSDWAAISGQSADAVLIDITKTPMGGVASDATVVAAYAQRSSTATAEVAIVRLDPSDAPNIYNVDKYLVWEDLPSHHNFSQIIQAASTEDNQNLRDYLKRNVFIVKLEPDAEHHRLEVPNTVRLLLPGRST